MRLPWHARARAAAPCRRSMAPTAKRPLPGIPCRPASSAASAGRSWRGAPGRSRTRPRRDRQTARRCRRPPPVARSSRSPSARRIPRLRSAACRPNGPAPAPAAFRGSTGPISARLRQVELGRKLPHRFQWKRALPAWILARTPSTPTPAQARPVPSPPCLPRAQSRRWPTPFQHHHQEGCAACARRARQPRPSRPVRRPRVRRVPLPPARRCPTGRSRAATCPAARPGAQEPAFPARTLQVLRPALSSPSRRRAPEGRRRLPLRRLSRPVLRSRPAPPPNSQAFRPRGVPSPCRARASMRPAWPCPPPSPRRSPSSAARRSAGRRCVRPSKGCARSRLHCRSCRGRSPATGARPAG